MPGKNCQKKSCEQAVFLFDKDLATYEVDRKDAERPCKSDGEANSEGIYSKHVCGKTGKIHGDDIWVITEVIKIEKWPAITV